MKAIRTALLALALTTPMIAVSGVAQANDAAALREAEWVCYYDRETYQIKYCQWE